MLVRVGTCQVCEATFQLPQRFEGSWASCRICAGAVLVGEPIDAELALKRGARKGGKAEGAAADGAGAATKSATAPSPKDAAQASRSPETAAPPAGTAQTPSAAAPNQTTPASEAPPAAPQASPATKPAGAAPTAAASPIETARPSAAEPAKWSPKALEAELRAERAALALPPKPAPAASTPAQTPPPPPSSAWLIDEMSLEELEPPISARPSTLERLKAERAEQARAAQRSAPTQEPVRTDSARPAAAAPAAKPGSTLERLKAERARAAAAAEAPQASSPGRASGAQERAQPAVAPARAERSARGSSQGRGEASDSEERQAGGRSGGRRPKAAAPAGRRGPHPMIAVGSLLLVGGLAALGLQQGWLDNPEKPAAPSEAAEGTEAPAPAAAPVAPPAIDPFSAGQAAATLPAAAAGIAQAPAAVPTPAGQPTAPAATPPAAPAKPVKDAASVDLSAYGPFERLPETGDEEWQKLQGWVKDLLNPNAGAEAGRARARLTEAGKAAFPALLNGLLALDYGTRDGMSVGNDGVQVFQKICRGVNYGWKLEDDPKAAEYFNKRVIELWAQRWQVAAQDEAAWAEMAKLNPSSEEEAGEGEDG
jgi:hypothetical protein